MNRQTPRFCFVFLWLGLVLSFQVGCTSASEDRPGVDGRCTEGETVDCIINGSTGVMRCLSGDWTSCQVPLCVQGDRVACRTACGTEGSAICGADGQPGSCLPPLEGCNGLDDDCDDQVDEELTRPCRCGAVAGTETCVEGEWTPCSAGTARTPEICDNLDNNCNDQIDDNLKKSCTTRCGEGEQICQYGEWSTCSVPEPLEEMCDGKDNDCDGQTDEGLGEKSCGVGQCEHSVPTCVAGQEQSCDPLAGALPEVCDGQDNDCDGQTDEDADDCCFPGNSRVCSQNNGECRQGVEVCGPDGRWGLCTGTFPTAEVCDGRDQDCDGQTDEGNPGGGRPCGLNIGVCEPGIENCIGGQVVCTGATDPVQEICDNRDNDCDGETDEGDPGGGVACGEERGECQAGQTRCSRGELVCEGAVLPGPEECDGKDNDCDGRTDEDLEGLGGVCGTDEGECQAGVFSCQGGAAICLHELAPAPEVCDGKDNDCDGRTDEDNPGGGGACGQARGACRPGVLTCDRGELSCAGGVLPVAEVCDGQDNDCDDQTDEGLPGDLLEINETCPTARDLGILLENGAPIEAEATLFSGAGEPDVDWYKVVATEIDNILPCGDPMVETCYTLTVTFVPSPGVVQWFCLFQPSCDWFIDQLHCVPVPPDTTHTAVVRWPGIIMVADDRPTFVRITGPSGCAPYQLRYEFTSTCPVGGVCPQE